MSGICERGHGYYPGQRCPYCPTSATASPAGPLDSVPSGDSVTLIERLTELARAATPGPWSASTDPGHAPSARVRAGRRWLAQTCPTLGVASDEDFANAAYIAAVSPDVLLRLLESLASATKPEASPSPENEPQDAEIGAAIRPRAEVIEALQFYAERSNWEESGNVDDPRTPRHQGVVEVFFDKGDRARKALASTTTAEPSPSFGETVTDDQAAVPLVASTGAESPRTTPAVSPSSRPVSTDEEEGQNG